MNLFQPRARVRLVCLAGVVLSLMCVAPWPLPAIDIFDRHTSDILQQVAESKSPLQEVSSLTAMRWKPLEKNLEASACIVKTDRGQWAKLLLSWGFRKLDDKPVPVVLIERFVTYESGRGDSTVANGRNIMLFPGFQFDLDLGQVVPAAFGGDLELSDKGVLKCRADVQLYPLDGPQIKQSEAEAQRNAQEGVVPADFAGVWQVDADGRFKGQWDLTVTPDGEIMGKFLSEETQASYPVAGSLGALPHHAKLHVQFNNAEQVLEAYLWTKDKNAMAGTFTLAGRTFGFYATRKSESDSK